VERNIYTLEDKFKAATAYMLEGTLRGAARVCGIPFETIRGWKKEPWWTDLVVQVIEEHADEYKAANHKIIQLAQDVALTRLKEGDPYVTKSGEVRLKPVSLREAILSFAVTVDKQRLLLNQPTSLSGKASVDPKELAKNFQKAASIDKTEVAKQIDATSTESLPPIEALLNEISDNEHKRGSQSDSPSGLESTGAAPSF
jgi:hypothetical protein